MNKERTRCLVYTRVMGYIRPASFYNIGKKSEFHSRVNFNTYDKENINFINQYKNPLV